VDASGTWQPSASHNLQAGIWDTALEGLVFSSEGAVSRNAFTFFAEAERAGIPVQAITPAEASVLERLALPEATRAAMREDLQRGYTVLTATALPAGQTFAGWWRVNPQTGEALGRGADGRGVELTEYMSFWIGQGVSLIFAVAGFGLCMAGASNTIGCCLVDTVTGYAVGWLAGLFAVGAISALAIGYAVDKTLFLAGTVGNVSWCFLETYGTDGSGGAEPRLDPAHALAAEGSCGPGTWWQAQLMRALQAPAAALPESVRLPRS
jgi:hypothetical protein